MVLGVRRGAQTESRYAHQTLVNTSLFGLNLNKPQRTDLCLDDGLLNYFSHGAT